MLNLDALCYWCMKESDEGLKQCPFCKHDKQFGQSDVRALPIQTILNGRYLVGRSLGCGGYGITYLGLSIPTRTLVAIKECMPDKSCVRDCTSHAICPRNEEDFLYALKHFWMEVEVLEQLRDLPETPNCLDSFNENQTAYYVMEYLNGINLLTYLNAHKKLTYEESLRLLLPIIVCLHAIHQRGILHRDISPDNIFLCGPRLEAKLIDFGSSQNDMSAISNTFVPALKRAYAPPEQFSSDHAGKQQSFRSDEYSLAATFYRCITGVVTVDAISRQAGDALPPPSARGAACNKKQDEVVMKALSMSSSQRYESVAQFGAALIDALPSDAQKRKAYQQYPILEAFSHSKEDKKPLPSPKKKEMTQTQSISTAHKSDVTLKRLAAWVLDYAPIPTLIVALLGFSCINLVAAILTAVVVNSIFEHSISATPGGLAAGLKTLRQDGETLYWRQAVLHSLLRLLLAPLFFVFILRREYTPPADRICKVAVVPKRVESAKDSTTKVAKTAATERWLLQITSGCYQGTIVPLNVEDYAIGRDSTACHLVYPDDCQGVSRVHCSLHIRPDASVELTDLRSTYGTYLNGNKERMEPEQPYPLHEQDSFRIGNEEIQLIQRGDWL